MVTSDFRPKVEIRPFRACAMKNMQYNLYLWPNRRNFRVFKEVGVGEHEGDVRFKSGSGNMAVSWMRNASGHNYRNSSFMVDLAMGQIPRSTERISSIVNVFNTLHTNFPDFMASGGRLAMRPVTVDRLLHMNRIRLLADTVALVSITSCHELAAVT